jgi:hypothetical protein
MFKFVKTNDGLMHFATTWCDVPCFNRNRSPQAWIGATRLLEIGARPRFLALIAACVFCSHAHRIRALTPVELPTG